LGVAPEGINNKDTKKIKKNLLQLCIETLYLCGKRSIYPRKKEIINGLAGDYPFLTSSLIFATITVTDISFEDIVYWEGMVGK
jgi:hypothetical protein